MKNEVILILSRKSNTLFIVVNNEIVTHVDNITGLYKDVNDEHTYAFLCAGNYRGLSHSVVHVSEKW